MTIRIDQNGVVDYDANKKKQLFKAVKEWI